MCPTKKTWVRASQITGKFPENKYDFTRYLQGVGDFVLTPTLSKQDYYRFRYAAYIWAYEHKCRVRVNAYRQLAGGYKVKVTLVNLHRERDYS